MKSLLVPCLGLLLALPAAAQKLNRYRIEVPHAEELAVTLEAAGFYVPEGLAREGSLEVIATDEELAALRQRGLAPILIEVERPFREVQEERGEDWSADVPTGYPDLSQIYAEMQSAAAGFPAICQFVDLTARFGTPTTFEGRSLFAVKISDNVATEEDEPAMLVVSAHHCGEIVTPVIALYAIERLTQGYATDPEIQALVDGYEIWIAPIWNPDGYEYVFNSGQNWRKNRRVFANGVGVDLNRNYPFGWTDPCAGSTNVTSSNYKGPSPASEPETQTLMALSNDVRFTKVIDFHSTGREVLWEYNCNLHPLAGYLWLQALQLSDRAGYGGKNRPPSANGEHYEWQLASFSSHSFLIETHLSAQPPFASAQSEAEQVWPALQYFLEVPIPVAGYVTDACSGAPVEASITYAGAPFANGETNQVEPQHGRYHAFLPPGPETLRFSAAGYVTQDVPVNVVEGSTVNLDVQLVPTATATATSRNGLGVNASCYTNVSPAVLGGNLVAEVSHAAHPGATFTVILGYPAASSGVVNKFGELLVDVGSGKIFQSLVASSGTQDTHTIAVPNEPCFAGFFVATQAVILGGGAESCNAVDYIVGN